MEQIDSDLYLSLICPRLQFCKNLTHPPPKGTFVICNSTYRFVIAVEIKKPLEEYVARHFPKGLIRVLRNSERKGLIAARLQGWRVAKGQVVSFFDSHMEVNDNWSVFGYRSLHIKIVLLLLIKAYTMTLGNVAVEITLFICSKPCKYVVKYMAQAENKTSCITYIRVQGK